MICKSLEKKLLLMPEDEGAGKAFELEYYLLESEANETDDNVLKGKKLYGIEIIKKSKGVEAENKTVRNFSCCRESTLKTVDRLARNAVTPLALPYILDDILAE